MNTETCSPVTKERRESNPVTLLFLAAGGLLLLLACLYNRITISALYPGLNSRSVHLIQMVQVTLLLAGVVLLSCAELFRRIPRLRALANTPMVAKSQLLLLGTTLPIFVMELLLRPFANFDRHPKTSLFLKDDELGWKMRPNAEARWSGTSIAINGKGLRGPELDYLKGAGVFRILYLGDSVTFGEELERWEHAFPFVAGSTLQKQLGIPIETINAGVSGYSPWQEFLYLEKEGIKYDPDLVVISFVLNDVTEKFELARFGGTGEGWQLSHTYTSALERLTDRSSIAYFARRVAAKIRFGRDVQAGATRKETLDVKALVEHPDRKDVQHAWEVTLEELDRIFGFCKQRNLPAILVVAPFKFQLEDPKLEAIPQKIVLAHAIERQIPAIDLLPLLTDEMARRGLKLESCLVDSCHFTVLGNEMVAEIISRFIGERAIINASSGRHDAKE